MGSGIVAVFLAIGVFYTSLTINEIRFGGPIQQKNQQMSDLIADILPPPHYIIESYLEATLAMKDVRSHSALSERLGELEKEYRKRHNYWKKSSLSPSLKTQLIKETGEPAEQFWGEVNQTFLPAIRSKNMDEARQSYAQLTAAYKDHRKNIDTLVKMSATDRETLAAISEEQLSRAITAMIVIALGVLVTLGGALILLNRHALAPLSLTANTMCRMAEGEFDVVVDGAERKDEIGTMAAAIEIFRQASKAKVDRDRERADSEEQARVVQELAAGLQAMTDGNFTHRIVESFREDYEDLRVSFNETIDGLENILSRVARSAQSVHAGSSGIRVASNDLAQQTAQRVVVLEETTATMNEVTEMVSETARSAQHVNNSINKTHQAASKGSAVVQPVCYVNWWAWAICSGDQPTLHDDRGHCVSNHLARPKGGR